MTTSVNLTDIAANSCDARFDDLVLVTRTQFHPTAVLATMRGELLALRSHQQWMARINVLVDLITACREKRRSEQD